MKKQLLLFIMTLLTTTTASADDSGQCGTNAYYSYDSTTHTLTISGKGQIYHNFSLPSCDVDHVIIESGIWYIGEHFLEDHPHVPSITIPSSLTSIDDDSFWFSPVNITDLEAWFKIDFHHNTGKADRLFLNGEEIKDLVIPNTVKSIRGEGSATWYGLTSVTIPNSVTSISSEAFNNCYNLTSIKVEDGNPYYDSRNNCNAIIDNNNQLIVGCKNTVIPNSVTSIGHYAFWGCTGLTSITIPNNVTSIGHYAFSNCSGLTSVTIGNSVTNIGESAFRGCSGLTSVTIPNSVTSIGSSAFISCSGLTSVTIPNSVTRIGSDAFYGCSGLTSVTIPNSVTSIGEEAFAECSGLTSIMIPNSVTVIGYKAFRNCSKLKNIVSEIQKPFAISDDVFDGIASDAVLNVPVGTKSAYKSTKGWSKFQNIVEVGEGETIGLVFESDGIRYKIGNGNTLSVTSGEDANYFGDLVIPSQVTYDGSIYSVTSIEKNAFHRNNAITSVTIANSVTSIGESSFGACTKLSSVTIPNSVTEIEPAAFYGCTALKEVNLPSGLKRIENNLFWGCTSLTSVTIPEGVTSIAEEAFRECSALPSIDIPNSVTEIGKSAFEKCSSLRVIIIGSGVTSIGCYAFANLNGERTRANNDNLKVYCKAETVPETAEDAFDRTPTELSTLYVPASAVEKYRAAWPWSDFKEIVPLDNPSIPDDPVSSSFTEKGINYVVKDDGTLEVTGIEDGTTIVDILSDVYIDGKAYQVTSIGERAFEGRHDIEYLSIPWSVTSIGEYAFIDCGSSNMAINIADPESWCQMKLGNEHSSPLSCAGKMLVHDIETTNVSIPESVTSIGAFTFYQCSCIKSLYIPGSVTSIGSSAFEDCDYLTSLTLSDGLQKIGGSTFQGCTRLQTLTIPSTVKSIKLNAFADCKGITDVYCYADIVPETDDIAFHGTPTEKSTLHVPANAIEAYRTTWPWSDFKEIVALDADGIAIMKSGDGNNVDSDTRIYDLQGNQQKNLRKGVNIIKRNNGMVKKVLVK